MPERLIFAGREHIPLPTRVDLYYRQTGKTLGGKRSIFANPEIHNISCDPRLHIANIVKLVGIKQPAVLTVLGDDYPAFFREIFPKSRICSFDINPNQLKYGNAETFISDIGLPGEMAGLLESTSPDLVFLSNIPTYLSPEQTCGVVEALKSHNTSHIITTEVPVGMDIISVNSSDPFIAALRDTYSCEYDYIWNSGSRVNLMTRN